MWAIRIEIYLEALNLWEAVEEDYEVLALPTNSTMALMKVHKERKTRKLKAKAMSICKSHSHHFHRDHVSKIN